ncbi:hypothetical protein [Corynebacterium rouxii]|uniref:DUF3168 domain-containing protein n=1 Tax=Corynebacterium rouxii TaxID=2719119 RepID=A0A6I8MH85_9CORY|nr:hypothetical protein [Corynebacterium rouxii]VZH85926.1 hypothetical protein FRC0190_01858 [Corynebacterium rouxii]
MKAAHIPHALRSIADKLTAAGIPATVDPTAIRLPGAWVAIDRIDPEVMGTTIAIDVAVYLTCADRGTTRALDALSDMLDTVLSEIDQSPASVSIEALSLPQYGAEIPTFKLVYQIG